MIRSERVNMDEFIIEECAEAVHKAYCDNVLTRTGKPYWTHGDYSKLDDEIKEIDRATVRAVLTVVRKFQDFIPNDLRDG